MTEFTRLRMVLSRIDKYLNELYGTDFSKLKQQPFSKSMIIWIPMSRWYQRLRWMLKKN